MSELKLDVDQAGELKAAFRREGPWTNEEIKMLCEQKGFLTKVRQVLLNFAEIKPLEHLINCDAKPSIPNGWSIVPDKEQLPNRVQGSFQWNPAQVKLYLSDQQRNGHELKKKLADKEVLPANVLDYLLANKHLIPEEWKGESVFFWGTVYRDAYGSPSVRYLYWYGGRWDWSFSWLGRDWDGSYPAALRASN